ncbi:exostosin-like 2 isoform X3 [Salarias fasciatus]|nr:exostosin-like 2 isoform X2 [Salarias fasciatus]XP_029971440.1 exostosin-like 2 isoform X3 [Salarias fasciatus]
MRIKLARSCPMVRLTPLLWAFLLILLVGAALTSLMPAGEHQRPDDDEDEPQELDKLDVLRRESFHREIHEEERETDELTEEQFTIIIQTYNRTDILLKLLNHYQAAPHLQRIVVVWNNIGERTPQWLWDSYGPHAVPVVFKEQTVNRMRNRLQVFPEIETDAVFMVDDDTLISIPDLSFAFSIWKQFREKIVGFVPRKHVSGPGGVLTYGSFETQNPENGGGDRYSMVLIGAAFFRYRHLQLFQDQPAEVHAIVDFTQNCDDIAMNFAVALDLKKRSPLETPCQTSGIFVKPVDFRNLESQARSGYQGMWHRPEHLLQRSFCLNKLAQIYGGMPLCYSNVMVSQFGFPNYANHKQRG